MPWIARQRSGFSLLLTVVLIGAIGVTLGLLCRHFVGLTWSVNRIALDVRAGQLLADGCEWAAAHPEQCSSIRAGGEVIDLPVNDLMPPGITATLRIACAENADGDAPAAQPDEASTPRQIVITAIVRQGKLASTSRATLPVTTAPPTAPGPTD